MKERGGQLGLLNVKDACSGTHHVRRTRRRVTNWEKTFAEDIPEGQNVQRALKTQH